MSFAFFTICNNLYINILNQLLFKYLTLNKLQNKITTNKKNICLRKEKHVYVYTCKGKPNCDKISIKKM